MASKKMKRHVKKFARKNPTAFVVILLILIFIAAGLFVIDYYNIYDLGFVDSEIKDDENDDDCSDEIFTETIEANIKLKELEDSMLDFAKYIYKKFY